MIPPMGKEKGDEGDADSKLLRLFAVGAFSLLRKMIFVIFWLKKGDWLASIVRTHAIYGQRRVPVPLFQPGC